MGWLLAPAALTLVLTVSRVEAPKEGKVNGKRRPLDRANLTFAGGVLAVWAAAFTMRAVGV